MNKNDDFTDRTEKQGYSFVEIIPPSLKMYQVKMKEERNKRVEKIDRISPMERNLNEMQRINRKKRKQKSLKKYI